VEFGAELEKRGITYALTGSVAAALYGEPRSTVDIDFTVTSTLGELETLQELDGQFYVPGAAIVDAVGRFESFNLIHHATGFKIHIFVLDDTPFNQLMMERRTKVRLGSGDVWTASPEDVTARKIRWYSLTDETSERQYRDIMALLSYGNVEIDTVVETAELIGLGDLARRLVEDALAP